MAGGIDFSEWRRQARLLARHARHGSASFGSGPSAARAQALGRLFRLANAHLRSTGAEYALAYGTLLGWHRGAGIIAHDRDVDFAAPLSAYPAIWESRRLLPAGMRMFDTSRRHHGPKVYLTLGGWEADVYFLAEEGGLLRSTERSRNPGDMKPFPRDYFFPLARATFLGEETFVPARPGELLLHIYGYIGADAVRDPVSRYFRPRS
ncbi:MAG TPA: hypothetical protein VGG34_15940 [Opitutaceae bacterium]|jgi:hypothetical protein